MDRCTEVFTGVCPETSDAGVNLQTAQEKL